MWNALASLKPSDWVLALAALIGPVLAVQAQKWVERWRERSGRKRLIFQTLMSTRSFASRLTIEHANALNMIDLVFYGPRKWGKDRQTKTEQAVTDAWKTYRTHLNTTFPSDTSAGGMWSGTSVTLFENLLVALAVDVGDAFDRVPCGIAYNSGMNRTGLIAALHVALFLFGVAWLDRAFEIHHVPHFTPEIHEPLADGSSLDDGRDDPLDLTVPPLPFMPRTLTGGFNQFVEQPPSFVTRALPTLLTVLTPQAA